MSDAERKPSKEQDAPGSKRGRGKDLTEGSVRRHILGLTGYMAIGSLASMTFQIVDTYFVAQLGTEALAAMAFTFPVVMILHAISVGLGTGVTSVVSRVVGGGGRTEPRTLATDSLLLAVLATAAFSAVGLMTIDPLFSLLGADAAVMPLIHDYMEIWYLGIVFMVVPLIGNSVIRAYGNAKFPSMIMSLAAVLNIALDPILIFGLFGAPRLELQGAALATVTARFITFAAALWVLHYRMHALSYEWPTLTRVAANWRKILHIGLPSTGTQLIGPVSMGILTALIASFGSVAVAAYGVATRVEMFSLIIVMAISISMGPFVGQNAGAGRIERVRAALRFSLQVCFIYGVLMAVLLAIFGPAVAGLFSDESDVVRMAAFYLLVVPVSYPVMSVIGISSQTFNSLAKPIPAMVIGAGKSLVVQVPFAYAGAAIGGIEGIFVSMAASTFVMASVAFVWIRRTITDEERVAASLVEPAVTQAE